MLVALATAVLYTALYFDTHDKTWLAAAGFFVVLTLVKA